MSCHVQVAASYNKSRELQQKALRQSWARKSLRIAATVSWEFYAQVAAICRKAMLGTFHTQPCRDISRTSRCEAAKAVPWVSCVCETPRTGRCELQQPPWYFHAQIAVRRQISEIARILIPRTGRYESQATVERVEAQVAASGSKAVPREPRAQVAASGEKPCRVVVFTHKSPRAAAKAAPPGWAHKSLRIAASVPWESYAQVAANNSERSAGEPSRS